MKYFLTLGFRTIFILFTLYTILITAWVGDDIQIVFRQVWNFISGDGITFNYGQRVQAFTHPLWFFVLSLTAFFTRELFLTTIILCIIFSILAVILLFRIEFDALKEKTPIISPVYALIFSWAFVDYATSGLENALSYFLAGLLICQLYWKNLESKLNLAYLTLALLVLNRFDYAILFFPLATVLFFRAKSIADFLKSVLPGGAILALWMAFATFYFGSPMPNTYYAKLHAEFPLAEVLHRGELYFLALRQDHVTTLILATGIILSFASRNRILVALAIGQLAYFSYIYNIGGDFMQGRFFSLPMYLAMGQIILAITFNPNWQKHLSSKSVAIFLAIPVVVGFFTGFTFLSGTDYQQRKRVSDIFDERGYYYQNFGLFSKYRSDWPEIVNLPETSPTEYKVSDGFVGGLSLLDTSYHLVDTGALTDPFLSRIPAILTENWRIGHHNRKIPQEYGEYLVGRTDKLYDWKLNALLKDVDLASRANLFLPERLEAIIRLNTNKHSREQSLSDYQEPDKFIPITETVEDVYVKNWDSAVQLEAKPVIFDFEFQRFNNNIRFISEREEIADGIVIGIGPFHTYDFYVNDKKVQVYRPKVATFDYYPVVFKVIRFENSVSVNSITLKAVDANYEKSPPFNYITQIKLRLDRK